MAAVHGPSIMAHPAGFQAHNMPGPRMGFHPAPAQPTVSAHNFSYVDFQLTFIEAPQQPKQPVVAQVGSKLIPTTATRTHAFGLQIYLHLLAGSQVEHVDWNRGGAMISETATVGSR